MEAIAFHPTKKEIVDIMIDLSSLSKDVKVLDTGYGEGVFLDGLVSKGYSDISGIEYSKEFYDKSLKNNNYNNIAKINGDYLSYKEKYNLIIGNPPYIKASKLDENMKEELYKLTRNNSSDIYYGFILNSILNLEDNGEIIYLLPKTFFTNKYAEYLRDIMLENGYFEYIIDFGELPIFDSANVEAIIFKYVKGKSDKKVKVINSINRTSKEYIEALIDILNTEKDNRDFIFFEKEQFKNKSTWNLSEDIKEIKGVELSTLVDIGVGCVSGCDDIFKLDEDTLNILNKKEKEDFVFDFLKARNLTGYVSTGDLTKMLFIPSKITSIEDLNKYPNIKEYLLENEEILRKRYFTSDKKPFFYWLAIRNLEKIINNKDTEVIAVPSFSRKTSEWFSISLDKDRYISSDIMMLSKKEDISLYFLLGYLNSEFFANYYNSIGIKKGQRFVFTQGFLSKIIIPDFSKEDMKRVEVLTKKIIENNESKAREEIEKIIINRIG